MAEPSADPRFNDELAIWAGIEQAQAEERLIDDATARRIACQLHTGQSSAMYSLASSGAVDYDLLSAEMRRETATEADPDVRGMYASIGLYAESHAGRDSVAGWHELTTDTPEGTTSLETDERHDIEIWIGCLATYDAGRLHGRWFDAAVESEVLHGAAAQVVASSPIPNAEDYYIGDYEGFYEVNVEGASIETVARVARLIAEHGEPFAKWLVYQGLEQIDYVEQNFEDFYLGEYPSREQYVEHVLRETEAYRFLESAPEYLRDFISVDLEAVADLFESEGLLVLNNADGEVVFVFNGRA